MDDFINMTVERSNVQLSKADFESDQMVNGAPVAVHMPFSAQWNVFSQRSVTGRKISVWFPASAAHPVSLIM